MAKSSWFKIAAPVASASEGKTQARIDIYGEIGWEVTASEFLRDLRALGPVDEIDLRIQSGGGSVLEGWAVANALKHHPATVNARVEGMAASMASVIAMAADTLEMPENAYLMIHNVTSFAIGDSNELRSQADLVDKLGGDIANFYAARTGKPVDEIKALMDATTWMDGNEAVAGGFADRVLPAVAAAAIFDHADVSRYDGAPAAEISAEPEPEPVVEPVAEEETPEVPAEVEPVVETPEPTASFLGKLIAKLSHGVRPDGAPDPSALEAADARAASAEARASEADAKAQALTAQVAAMEAEAKKVWDLCAEVGFTPAAAAVLPAPDASEDGAMPGASIRERFNAITDQDERRAFFKKHEAELLK